MSYIKNGSTPSFLLPAPSLSYFVGGVLLIQPTFSFSFLNGLKNFVTVGIFMMSVNKKDLLFSWCGHFIFSDTAVFLWWKMYVHVKLK